MSNNHFRNLPVPFLTQRQNDYLWYKRDKDNFVIANQTPVSMDCRTCNITSVMMVKNKRVVLNCDKNINNKYKFNNKEPDKQNGLTWTDHYKNIRKRVFGCTNTETNMC